MPDNDQRVDNQRTPRLIQSVLRAGRLLRAVSDNGSKHSLSDLAACTGVHKSTAYRLLASLEHEGLVSRDPVTGHYQLGLQIVAMSGIVLGQEEILRIADPHLRRLADITDETVNLGIRYEGTILNIEQIPGPNVLKSLDWLGQQSPLHKGAGAKALLAFLSDDEANAYLESLRPALTVDELTNLIQELDQIRALGFAVNRGEIARHVYAVGAPVLNAVGIAQAGVSVAGYQQHFDEERIQHLAQLVMRTTATISRQLGHDGQQVAHLA